MSQQSSLTQSAHSVRQVLTAYNVRQRSAPLWARGSASRGADLVLASVLLSPDNWLSKQDLSPLSGSSVRASCSRA
jgi:hypothetical protein